MPQKVEVVNSPTITSSCDSILWLIVGLLVANLAMNAGYTLDTALQFGAITTFIGLIVNPIVTTIFVMFIFVIGFMIGIVTGKDQN